MTKKKPEPNAATPYDKMTSRERTAIHKFLAQNNANPAPRLKVLNEKQAVSIAPDHPDKLVGQMLLMDALGRTSTSIEVFSINWLMRIRQQAKLTSTDSTSCFPW